MALSVWRDGKKNFCIDNMTDVVALIATQEAPVAKRGPHKKKAAQLWVNTLINYRSGFSTRTPIFRMCPRSSA
jgi:hypothetical protein